MKSETTVHTEKLIPLCGSQLEGAGGLGRRNEINHDKEVGRAVSLWLFWRAPWAVLVNRGKKSGRSFKRSGGNRAVARGADESFPRKIPE